MLTLDDLDFSLPEERIAQQPLPERDASRLLVVHRETGEFQDRRFGDITSLLSPGDVLVVNDTRVLSARLRAVKPATGADIEVLLLEERDTNEWDALVRPGRRAPVGTVLRFQHESLSVTGEIAAAGEGGERRIRFHCEGDVAALLDDLGEPPLPPYIKRPAPDPADRDRYQTVYARYAGAVAAPTAGLHFTPELLSRVKAQDVLVAPVTLHVGLGTFEPLQERHLATGRLHGERFTVSADSAAVLNAARRDQRRIVAVGTTAVRVLETVYQPHAAEPFRAAEGRTDLFIRPGYTFRAVDAMVTNFHLPRSSLFALVCAFAGRELMHRAYAHAVAAEYRFYSYGDATFLC